MQVNRAFSAPAIASRVSDTEPLAQKKVFGQANNPAAGVRLGSGAGDVAAERRAAHDLKASEQAMKDAEHTVVKCLRLVQTFNDFVVSVRRLEARRRRQKEAAQAQAAAAGKEDLWRQAAIAGPAQQQDHAKLCRLLLAQYRAKLDEMFASGHMRKVWEDPASHAHLFAKAVRDTVSYRQPGEGRGEPSADGECFTDIAARLKRQLARWRRVPDLPFIVSGPRFKPPPDWLPDVDTVGLQVEMMKKWWGRRGVKFNDVDRDTMAFAKSVAPQGATRYYEKKSTLDEVREYRFPFKCTGSRFAMTEEELLTAEGGQAAAAARRRKGLICTLKGKGMTLQGIAAASAARLAEATGQACLPESTLGVHRDDPLDDEDLGLPTDYLRRLKPHERFGTMKSKALQARLKGPSPSFLSKVDRSLPPVYLRKEVFADTQIGSASMSKMAKAWTANSRQLFGRAPSGREPQTVPDLRINASRAARPPIPETLEEFQRMQRGLPLKRKRGVGGGGTSRSGSRTGGGGGGGGYVAAGGSTFSQAGAGGGRLVTGGSALLGASAPTGTSRMVGGSALLNDGKEFSATVSGGAPSIPSRVPGDSMVDGGGTRSTGIGDEDDFLDDDDEDGGEAALYEAMAAEAEVDAIMSFDTEKAIGGSSSKLSSKWSSSKSRLSSRGGSKLQQGSMRSSRRGHSTACSGSSSSSSRSTRRRQGGGAPGMQITVRSPAGAYVSLRVSPSTTVGEIKQLVTSKTGLSQRIREQLAACALMVFRKRALQPEMTLAQAGVANGSTLQALQYAIL